MKRPIPSLALAIASLRATFRRTEVDTALRPDRPGSWDRVLIRGGKIEPPDSCGADIVDHCNLDCLDCNHGSPVMKRRFADPAIVYRDFSVLAKAYRPAAVKVLGGEPLLHPGFVEVLDAIHRSRVSRSLVLVTNGLLLSKMPDRAWKLLDEVVLSVYPDSPIGEEALRLSREKGARHRVKVSVSAFDRFNRFFTTSGYRDSAMVRRVYRSCRLAHEWGCHSIRDGFFFKCPQSHCFPLLNGEPKEWNVDGIEIRDSPALLDDLRRYLLSPEPLESCRNCLGSSGKSRPHVMARPDQWLAGHAGFAEDLIDFDKLRTAEAGLPEEARVRKLIR